MLTTSQMLVVISLHELIILRSCLCLCGDIFGGRSLHRLGFAMIKFGGGYQLFK